MSQFKVGDRVKVVGDVEFSGSVGTVFEIIEGWDYPYSVEFGQDAGPFLYAEDELEAVK